MRHATAEELSRIVVPTGGSMGGSLLTETTLQVHYDLMTEDGYGLAIQCKHCKFSAQIGLPPGNIRIAEHNRQCGSSLPSWALLMLGIHAGTHIGGVTA